MPYRELQKNWETFSALIEQMKANPDKQMDTLIKRYVEQNMTILNDVFATSIQNLQKLQTVKTTNDIICIQACLTNEVSKKLSLSAQRFLNASLGHIADYNEWLKAHCDLATEE